MIIIPRRASCIWEATAPAKERASLATVRIREFSDQYWLEATDGRIAAICRGPTMDFVTKVELPPLDGGKAVFDYLVNEKDWNEVWSGKEEFLGFASDGKTVWICSPNGIKTCQAVNGGLPPIHGAVERTRALLAVTLDSGYIHSLAALARKYFHGSTGQPHIRLLVGMPDQPVRYHMEDGPNILEGLVMPVCAAGSPDLGNDPGTQEYCQRSANGSGSPLLKLVTAEAETPARKPRATRKKKAN